MQTHSMYVIEGKWQQKIYSRDSKTVYKSLLQNVYICFASEDILTQVNELSAILINF